MMIRLIVKDSVLSSVHKEKDFIYAIQIARILGAISYYTILYIKINADGDTTNNLKCHLYLNQGALIYTGIKKLKEMEKHIKRLDYYKRNPEKFKTIYDQLENSKSFINNIMGKIRNKVTFHFDEVVVKNVLKDYLEDFIKSKRDVVFMQGKSEAAKDITYDLADDMNLNYILKKINGEGKSIEDKFRCIAGQFFSIMSLFQEILEGLLSELASPYCEVIKE